MGSDNPKIQNLRLVETWLKICRAQIDALSEGQFDKLEQLIAAGDELMLRLEQSHYHPEPQALGMLQEIETLQSRLIEELNHGTQLVGEQLASLRRNLNALGGYRQPTAKPNLLNRRT
ncbi:MAG: hypothetical protein BWY87_01251 [Deltaproteobacteria bacterium ADurb.Bin510]|nr:MAG: hypothetical protein BWY87_01251 [Deltaproteobacteria bacterium ADurb.Bin510]